ncbi:MAG: hypothetical protein JSS79_05565 [Bacteroidetes bacterium]|nr:hypothetical protein [Bacteroidota bacterium]
MRNFNKKVEKRDVNLNPTFLKLIAIVIFFITGSLAFSQVPNLEQSVVIESGNGTTPNLTGAYDLDVVGNFAYVIGRGDALEILDITLPGLPVHKGSLSNSIGGASLLRPSQIVVSGGYAYVTSYGGGALEIVDVSDPSNPKHKGKLEKLYGPRGVAISGNYAYVAAINSLYIVDIKDPANPKLASSIAAGKNGYLGQTSGICISGQYAFVGSLGYPASTTLGGIEVFDVSNPSLPVQVGSLPHGGNGVYLSYPYNLRIVGNLLYTVDLYNSAFEIVDVSIPSSPKHKGSLKDGVGGCNLKSALDLAVRGNTAFVTNYYNNFSNANLEIIDVTDPTAPKHTSNIQNSSLGSARGIKVVNNYAFVTSEKGNCIEVIDVTSLSAPVVKTIVNSGGGGPMLTNPTSVCVYNNFAYVVGQDLPNIPAAPSALEIIDVSNPVSPKHQASYQPGGVLVSVAVSTSTSDGNTYAYMVDKLNSKLYVVNATNPSAPILASTLTSGSAGTTFGSPTSVVVSGTYAYLTGSTTNSLEILDISNPYLPKHVATLVDNIKLIGPKSTYVTTSKDGTPYAFITCANMLTAINLTTKTAPFIAATLTDGGINAAPKLNNPVSVFVNNGIAYVASNGTTTAGTSGLEIIDVSNPASGLTHLGAITDLEADIDRPTGVTVSGNYAFLSGLYGIEVVDITNPASPIHQTHLYDNQRGAFLDTPYSIFLSNGYAYLPVFRLSSGLSIVSVFAPAIGNPSPISGPVGSTVTLQGQNLNTFLTASINGVSAPITSLTSNSITVTIPKSASIGRIVLSYNGQNFSSSSNFIVTPNATSAAAIGQSDFTATWSNVGASTYYLDVSSDNFSTFVSGYNSLNVGNVTSYQVSGLAEGTSYQYRIRSSDGVQTSGNSNSVSVSTLPSTPVASAATLITQSSFTANWALVSSASSYSLDVSTDSLFNSFISGGNNVTVSSSSYLIDRLAPFTKYFYRVRAINSSGSSAYSEVISVKTSDNVPPLILPSAIPNPTSITQGNTPLLNMNVSDNVLVALVKLFYRGISKQQFDSVAMQGPGGIGGNYSVILQTSWYDSLGMEYYVKAVDGAGNRTTTASSFIKLNTTAISLPPLPSGDDAGSYRIVSFPYKLLSDNNVTTVYSNVPWNDFTKASLWWWNPASKNGEGGYDQYGKSNSFKTIDPGKGYWIITRNPITPQLNNVPAPEYSRTNLFQMTLKPGWNQIGNPYPATISWDNVIALNQKLNPKASFSNLYLFDGTSIKEATGNTTLKPFEGGFVKNLSTTDIVITIPFSGQTSIGGRTASITSDLTQEAWKVFLYIHQDGVTNQLGGFGMNPYAQVGDDRFDNFNPPMMKQFPELAFANGTPQSTDHSLDVVPPKEHYAWTFVPKGNVGSLTRLDWSDAIRTNPGQEVLLFDEENLMVIDMRATSSYSFRLTPKSRFRIVFGSDAHARISVSEIVATSPWPNPLNSDSKCTIAFGLPDTSSEYVAQLQLYSLQGESLGAVQEKFPAGMHHLDLALSETLAPGMYIYKLSISSDTAQQTFTGKLVKP